MPKIRIPRFTAVQFEETAGHVLEVLIAAQLLFLNNFTEPLCKKAKHVLKTIFDRLRLDHNNELIIGETVVQENGENINYPLFSPPGGLTNQMKLNIVLLTCAMLYNFC